MRYEGLKTFQAFRMKYEVAESAILKVTTEYV